MVDSSSVSRAAISRLKSQRASVNTKSSNKSSSSKIKYSTVPKSVLEGAKIEYGNGKKVKASGGSNIKTSMTDTKAGIKTTTISTPKGVLLAKKVKNANTGKILSSFKANTQLQRIFTNSGLGFLSNTYNESQLKRVMNNLDNQRKLALMEVDRRRDLNAVQKEIKKREVLGLKESDFGGSLKGKQNTKNKQLAELIKISPSEALAKKVVNGESNPKSAKNFYK